MSKERPVEEGTIVTIGTTAFGAAVGLAGLAYRTVIARFDRLEKDQAEENQRLWTAIDGGRKDLLEVVKNSATKDDLNRMESRLVEAIRGRPAA